MIKINLKCFLDKNIDEAEKNSKESSVDQQLPNPTPDLLATPVEPIPVETPRTLGGMHSELKMGKSSVYGRCSTDCIKKINTSFFEKKYNVCT